jgi:PAS domain S-box-containing protein
MLQASAERYRALVERRPECIRCFDRDRRLTFVNDAYCRRLGRPRADLLGSDLLRVIPPATVQATWQHLALLSPRRHALTYEIGSSEPDGSVRWEEWSEQALFDSAGEVVEHWSITSAAIPWTMVSSAGSSGWPTTSAGGWSRRGSRPAVS